MFTVKATYRGETRKLSLPCESFPTYDELCSQLYRVFPINNSYYLSRVLFSPNATSASRVLLATEIQSQDDYQNAVQAYSGRLYTNALLRFSVYDHTPHKQPSNIGIDSGLRASEAFMANLYGYTAQGTSSNSNLDTADKRPIVPPKPPAFQHPFEYIASLSGRTPSISSRAPSLRSVPVPAPMDVDNSNLPQPQSQAQSAALPMDEDPSVQQTPRSSVSMTSGTSCCSAAEMKQEIQVLITNFEKDVNRSLEKGFGTPAPQLSISLSESASSNNVPAESADNTSSSPVDLGTLFAEGSFPASGPARRASTRSTCTRNSSIRAKPRAGCLNAEVTPQPQQQGRPLPQVPEPVVHNHVICDSCSSTVVGVRHKCLDCPDYDLCSSCMKDGGAEKHNPFHEFFDIREPGRVIVHTVFSEGERSARSNGNDSTATVQNAPPTPVAHNAMCDLCDLAIVGARYKCCDCPDFDTCGSCFNITPEQHPTHAFFKIENPKDYIRRDIVQRKAHYARCDSCMKTIYGVRFKCMHPECPDFDLCDRCEAMPIAVHPATHPMLKMKTPDAVIPTVYRVGGAELIPPPPFDIPKPQIVDLTPTSTYREGYSPLYLTGVIPVVAPVPVVGHQDEVQEDERAVTPKPQEIATEKDSEKTDATEQTLVQPVQELTLEQPKEVETTNPFVEPAPMIEPFGSVLGSMVSSFTASFEDRIGAFTPASPLAEAAERERSLFEGFLDRPVSAPIPVMEEKKDQPSFVNDVWKDFFKNVTSKKEEKEDSEDVPVAEPEMKGLQSPLSILVTNQRGLLAMVEEKENVASPVEVAENEPAAVAEEKVEEEVPVEETVEETVKEDIKPAPAKDEEETFIAPILSAGFISDVTVSDGQEFPPGAEFMKCWRMVNDGNVDWPESTEVVFVAGQAGLVAPGNESVKIGSVKAGQQVDVWTGELKAPELPGRYVGYWRLRDGETKEVFGNSIWVEIQVVEAEHLSDESSLSGSSIMMMPTVGLVGTAPGSESVATSVTRQPESLTLTIPSSGSTSVDGESDPGSDVSLIDVLSSSDEGESEAAWEDARSRLVSESPAPAPPRSPVGEDFELVYDSSSDM